MFLNLQDKDITIQNITINTCANHSSISLLGGYIAPPSTDITIVVDMICKENKMESLIDHPMGFDTMLEFTDNKGITNRIDCRNCIITSVDTNLEMDIGGYFHQSVEFVTNDAKICELVKLISKEGKEILIGTEIANSVKKILGNPKKCSYDRITDVILAHRI